MYVVQTILFRGIFILHAVITIGQYNVSSIDFFVIIFADKLINMQYLQQYCQ